MSDKPGSACGVRQMKSRLLHLSPGSGHNDRLEADRSHGRREDRENTVELLAGASAELVAMRTIFAADQMGLPVSTMHVRHPASQEQWRRTVSECRWIRCEICFSRGFLRCGCTYSSGQCCSPRDCLSLCTFSACAEFSFARPFQLGVTRLGPAKPRTRSIP